MTLEFEKEYEDYIFPFDEEKLALTVIDAVLDQENCPYECEVSLVLSGEEEIRQANREFRQIDRVTDVLSFPMQPFPAPASYDFLEEADDAFHPETGELLLGDILICIPRMLAQAEEYGHGVKREYAFLIAHSMLHLLGYDHMTPEEAEIMEQKQNQVLEKLKITRGEANEN